MTAVLFAAACSAAACSNALGDAPDYEIVSTPPADPDNASAPSEEKSLASGDAPQREDEPLPGSPEPSTWCSSHPARFCADFDGAKLPGAFSAMDGSLLAVITRPNETPALDLTVPAVAAGPSFASKLTQPFADPSSDMTLAFDIWPHELNTLAGVLLVTAIDFFDDPNAKYSVRLTLINGRARIEEAPGPVHPLFDLPTTKRSRVQLDVVLGTTSGTLGVTVDGEQVGSTIALTVPAQIDRRPTLQLGAVYGTTPTSGWKISYDNVTMDLR